MQLLPLSLHCLLVIVLLQLTSAFNVADFTGVWNNELDSHVNFTFHENGTLTGWYLTAVGDDTYIKDALYGDYLTTFDGGAVVTFGVAWSGGPPQSATAWAGRIYVNLVTGHKKLVTLWHLVSETTEADEWEAFLTNKDVFVKDSNATQIIVVTTSSTSTTTTISTTTVKPLVRPPPLQRQRQRELPLPRPLPPPPPPPPPPPLPQTLRHRSDVISLHHQLHRVAT